MSSRTTQSSSPSVSAAVAQRNKAPPPSRTRASSSSSPSGSHASESALSSVSQSHSSSGCGSQDSDDNVADNHIVRWTKKPRRKRAGWGPYQSVLNERSVDFNLTLDVQNLKQEIKTMEMMRDILASKTMIQRHDPEGSLVRIAQEHYRIFRTGFNLRQSGRKRLMNERDQKEFLRSVFDEHVDVGGDENGIHVLEQQIMLYTVFIKAIAMTMTGFDVITTDDTVIVSTRGILHFQILRNTIAGMFPHVMSEEWLVSKLVGREVAPESKLSFYFNKHNKVYKFVAELDFVKTFAEVLSDPAEVDVLLGRARITENCLIIPSDDTDPTAFDRSPDVSAAESSPSPSKSHSDVASGCDGDTEDHGSSPGPAHADDIDHSPAIDLTEPEPELELESALHAAPPHDAPASPPATLADVSSPKTPEASEPHGKRSSSAVVPLSAMAHMQSSTPAAAPVHRGPMTPVHHFNHVVQAYFRIFAQGSHPSTEPAIAQFLDRYFSREAVFGEAAGRQVIADRWRSLSWCFNVLSFRRLDASGAPAIAVYEPSANRYRINACAEYTLQLTQRSLDLVFPHVKPDRALSRLLAGALVLVASDVTFWLERATGLMIEMQEQMDFESALSTVVSNSADLAFVVAGAAPILMSFSGEVPVAATASTAASGDGSNL